MLGVSRLSPFGEETLDFKISSLRSSSDKYDDDDDTFIKVSKL